MDWLSLALPIVKRWEGCRLTAYLCPAGVWTIGWGETGPDVVRGVVWTQKQADDRLASRLREFGGRVDALVTVPLKAHEMAALVSLAYNIGVGAFRGSTLLKKLNAGDRVGASQQFLRWNRAGGRVMQGLTNRRMSERALFVGANG